MSSVLEESLLLETELRIGDAFGEMLQAAFYELPAPPEARWTYDIVEREDGNLLVTPAAHWFQPPALWPEHIVTGMERARGRVLDVGCGAGRHALALQEQGEEVTGLDTSPGALKVCRRRGLRSVVHATVADHAVNRAADGGRYDTFLLLGANVGLLQGRASAPAFLGALAAMATPGARIIADSMDPDLLSELDPTQVAYGELNRRRGRLPGQTRMRVRHKTMTTSWFDYLYCSPAELGELAEGTAWRVEEILPSGGPSYVATLVHKP
ncbi:MULTISPECIES: methyltransferase domain-containing protein [unclassified Nonomuraea]|uniref:class I SAM-dependent methyltransferase n=1 Tax=unclassified Nonomuraea TaxID=2593643 RepID=UPI0033CF45F5